MEEQAQMIIQLALLISDNWLDKYIDSDNIRGIGPEVQDVNTWIEAG